MRRSWKRRGGAGGCQAFLQGPVVGVERPLPPSCLVLVIQVCQCLAAPLVGVGDGRRDCAARLGVAVEERPRDTGTTAKRLVAQAESRQRLLQTVDGAGSGLEGGVEAVGGGIVGCSLGQLSPLLAFTPPAKKIRAGEHELVAAERWL